MAFLIASMNHKTLLAPEIDRNFPVVNYTPTIYVRLHQLARLNHHNRTQVERKLNGADAFSKIN